MTCIFQLVITFDVNIYVKHVIINIFCAISIHLHYKYNLCIKLCSLTCTNKLCHKITSISIKKRSHNFSLRANGHRFQCYHYNSYAVGWDLTDL